MGRDNNDKPIIVYWAPPFPYRGDELNLHPLFGRESNIYYKNPKSLFLDLIANKSSDAKNKSFFACPAVSKKFKNTIVFRSPMGGKYFMNFTDKFNPIIGGPDNQGPCLPIEISRNYSIDSNPIMLFSFPVYLFAEESLEISLTAPYFHEPKILKYGSIIPGNFDIGQWFRPIHCELNFWHEKQEFKIEENEPLFYIEFLTNRPIILKRFIQTEKTYQYSLSLTGTPTFMEDNVPLIKRYKRFKESGMREILLKEIKQNIIEEDTL